MEQPLPQNLADSIPDQFSDDAIRWWQSLTETERKELTQLCDARREIFLFETFSDPDSPKVTGGKFIPHDDAVGFDEWGEDYFQHLLDHPELMIVYDAELRTFHVGCSRHVEARRCFTNGTISTSFNCPFRTHDCLQHKIRQNRPTVRLRPLAKPIR